MRSTNTFSFVFFLSFFNYIAAQDDQGNPHFQVDHKSGKLDIMATRTSADIQSTEDYVDLLMKPGEGLESSSHNEDTSEQRHETPKQPFSKGKTKTGWRDKSSTAEGRDKEEKVQYFDKQWENLFKFPKANKTTGASFNKNATINRNQTEGDNQIDVKKMNDLEKNAKDLAEMIQGSTSRGDINPNRIKDAASKLEEQVASLQNDVLKNFVNSTLAPIKSNYAKSGKEKASKEKEENKADSKEKNEDEINSPIVPKLSGDNDGNQTSSNLTSLTSEKTNKTGNGVDEEKEGTNENSKGNDKEKFKKAEEKQLKEGAKEYEKGQIKGQTKQGKEKSTEQFDERGEKWSQEWKASSQGDVNIDEKEGAVQAENRESQAKGKTEKQDKSDEKPKKGSGKKKYKELCSDCGTKIPKVGDKNNSSSSAVPKYGEDNETTSANGFNQESMQDVKAESNTNKYKDSKEKTEADSKNDSKKNKDSAKGKEYSESNSSKVTNTLEENKQTFNSGDEAKDAVMAKKKPCKNCGGKIAKTGNKTDDGKLIVPKLTKENETKEHSEKVDQTALEKETSGHQVAKIATLEKEESFDLDDDSEEITEDANYAELSSGKAAGNVNTITAESGNQERSAFAQNVTSAPDEGAWTNGENMHNKAIIKEEGNITQAVAGSNVVESEALKNKTENQSESTEAKIGGLSSENNGTQHEESEKEDGNNGNVEKEKGDDDTKEETEGKFKTIEENVEKNQGLTADETGAMRGTKSQSLITSQEQKTATGLSSDEPSALKTGKNSSQLSADKLTTVKQFDDLLNKFLKNATTEKKKQLLKLTWHDLRARYKDDQPKTNEPLNDKSNSGLKNNINSMGQRMESQSTGINDRKAETGKTQQKENIKTIVGRIKEKISLLKDLMAYSKMKKLQKLNKSTKLDPYAGFKREEVSY